MPALAVGDAGLARLHPEGLDHEVVAAEDGLQAAHDDRVVQQRRELRLLEQRRDRRGAAVLPHLPGRASAGEPVSVGRSRCRCRVGTAGLKSGGPS